MKRRKPDEQQHVKRLKCLIGDIVQEESKSYIT